LSAIGEPETGELFTVKSVIESPVDLLGKLPTM
jgi:hypothetical protein